ncbi:MAG: hypothetical protein KY453_03105 [Gemmatimonadetes bacterium]|nr:hypothetical protein [Gemmatimonadota bacterium]
MGAFLILYFRAMPAHRTLPLLAALLAGLAAAPPAPGQEPDTAIVVTGAPTGDDLGLPDLDEGTTPGGAFLRAVLLPGWGHASIGAYTRGGFYFGVETATAFMLVRNARRHGAAQDVRDLREGELRDRLEREGVTDPATIEERLDQDEGLADARQLVDARSQQIEDWAALGIFLVFLSGADAFVSAHLADFPDPVELEAAVVPTALGLRMQVGARVLVGPPRG